MTIPKIEPPDSHWLSAAMGWLELGNPTEAGVELAQISPAIQEHPAILEIAWQIQAELKNWAKACEIARLLVQKAPDSAAGWVHQAYALRRAPGGSLAAAWEVLHAAQEKFPQETIIPYNLACYAAQMERVEEAWEWLNKAMEIGDQAKVKAMALADPDLQALWQRLS